MKARYTITVYFFCRIHPVELKYKVYSQVWMEASRGAYKRNITLSSVRQHNYFITQGNYIGYMFRL